MRLLSYEDLPAKGIRRSKVTLWRWERAGRFPKRVRVGFGFGWIESEVDAFLAECVAQRDASPAS